MNDDNISVFKTSDMPLIAFLRYEGYTVQSIEKVSSYKAEFIFLEIPRSLLNDFNTDKCSVEPRNYAATMHQQMRSAKMAIQDK